MKRYLKTWFIFTSRVTEIAFASRLGVVFFTLGKVFRFVFFLIFLLLLSSRIEDVAGYTLWEVILFYLTFNLIDTLTQFFFREVYKFRQYIITGNFDYILTKPLSPLFRSLLGGSDVLDLLVLVPLLIFIGYSFFMIGVTPIGIGLYILLVFNAFLIAMSLHIFVLALGVVTTEVDNAIWMIRDITQLGRIPVDIYREPLRLVLTFIIPVAAMITIPVQSAIGIFTLQGIGVAFLFSGVFLLLSLKSWNFALKKYTSASS